MARKEVIQIRCSALEKDRWQGAADNENLALSAWIRLTLDKTTRLSEARTAIGHKQTEPVYPEPPYDPWLEVAPTDE